MHPMTQAIMHMVVVVICWTPIIVGRTAWLLSLMSLMVVVIMRVHGGDDFAWVHRIHTRLQSGNDAESHKPCE